MPSLRVHCAISKKRTGNSFEELHKWIDELRRELEAGHRRKRHYLNKRDR